ncbi:MAG: hypothetical protein HDT28_01755 [Clostridiales bacterium]|nr:hypothetical protein [Clostridiales bacterium]
MNYKLNNINYSQVIPKYISNIELANDIQHNINFIEKYVDIVETYFVEDSDKQLAYKQLGIMAFSCVEAFWKNLILAINNNCASRKCHKKCNYRAFNSFDELNRASPRQVLSHLTNVRILYVHPFEEIAIEELQNLRNHIHLTRVLSDGNKATKFNKQFVEDMLRLYYVTINQAEMNAWYYSEANPCLRDMDGDSYEINRKQQQQERERYYTDKTILALIDIFYEKQINEKNAYFLSLLSNSKVLNVEYLIDDIGKWLYYEGAHFRTEESYQEAIKKFYLAISKYAPNYNWAAKIESQRKYYQKFFNVVS